jgi:hypothetical protein
MTSAGISVLRLDPDDFHQTAVPMELIPDDFRRLAGAAAGRTNEFQGCVAFANELQRTSSKEKVRPADRAGQAA